MKIIKGEELSRGQSSSFHVLLCGKHDPKMHLHEACTFVIEDMARRGKLRSSFLMSVELEQDALDHRWLVRAFTKTAVEVGLAKWIRRLKGKLKYRLGLTHQFHCPECGAPQNEKWRDRWAGGWEWCCDFCGWENTCLHRPRILKCQHRCVLAVRRLWWRVSSIGA